MDSENQAQIETIDSLMERVDSDTNPGSYFVTNYPPYSYWTFDEIQPVKDVVRVPADAGTPLGIYFHIPFCRKRCHFCYFKVYTDKNASEIRHYIETGLKEIELYADTPRFAGRKPKFIYFGGGTPSYLSAKQLHELTSRMKEIFPWDEVQEVAFEGEPGTLNEKKLRAIKDAGITRLSLGVENFDDHILEINGRAHRSDAVWKAWDHAVKMGFDQLNIDLIAGMLDETEQNWERCIDKTLEMMPDSVTIYQMEVPYNTTIYKRMKEEGALTAPVPDWRTKREWVKYAYQRLEDAGYTVTSETTAVKDPSRTKFIYRDELWRGADLLGMGVASFSHAGGVHFQNLTEFGAYMDAIERGELPLKRSLQITAEEAFIREFILQMKLGHVSRSYFKEKFGEDLDTRYAVQLSQMEARGLLEDSGNPDEIILTRDALLLVDMLVHAFFLPQHQLTSPV